MSTTVLLRRPEVERRTGIRRSHIYALIGSGEFPAPIRLGHRAVAWLASDVEAWIQARIRDSRARRAGG